MFVSRINYKYVLVISANKQNEVKYIEKSVDVKYFILFSSTNI